MVSLYHANGGYDEGDIIIMPDENKTYIHNGGTAMTSADFTLLETPLDVVTSVAGKTGAVTLVKGDVGLGNVDNTADSVKAVASAAKLTTARTITLGGDVSGSTSFDGSGNVTISVVIADDSHNHTISNIDGLSASLNSKQNDILMINNDLLGNLSPVDGDIVFAL